MALFIRDAEVDALAEEVRKVTNAKTKTEAVRRALEAQLAKARRTLPLRERLARSKALAAAMGPSDPAFDMKAHTDEMWGDGFCSIKATTSATPT
jgi:antitoxin VapB